MGDATGACGRYRGCESCRPDLRECHRPAAGRSAVQAGLILVQELVAHLREAFGWNEDVLVSAGPRGALGQIWRLDVGSARHALEEIFAGSPSETLFEAELVFTRCAAEAGVQLPTSHPDGAGRHLITAPGGRWAEREIDEGLRLLPTSQQLADVLEMACPSSTGHPWARKP